MSSSQQVTTSQQSNQLPTGNSIEPSSSNPESASHRNNGNEQGDTLKKRNRNHKHRGKKKSPNVVNATETGAPKAIVENNENKTSAKDNSAVNASSTNGSTSSTTNKKKVNNNKPKVKANSASSNVTNSSFAQINKNRAQGRLTETQDENDASTSKQNVPNKKKNNNRPKKNAKLPPGNHDMATILSHELNNSSYECMVCMDFVRPAHHVWNCDCCWAVFHLNCIQTWATKSLKDPTSNKMVTGWRCPGCQNNRTAVPKDYLCFCGKQRNPNTSRYHTPHSCEQLCKKRKQCPHECVLPCHPGPCPPCSSMGPIMTCYCGTNTRQARCIDTDYSTKGFSCEEVCDELLGCGKHRCENGCHAGLCPPCDLEEIQSCYCGRHERTARCGSGKQVQLRGHVGYYSCTEKCDTAYVCGQHRCEKPCHPCSTNSKACPSDPTVVKSCPCESHTVAELLKGADRTSCTDPIPTCDSTCNKVSACGHKCVKKCHLGECPPCDVKVEVLCRCHSTAFEDTCANVCEATGGEPPLCNRICKSIRNCSRHQCGTRCCPAMKINGKKKDGTGHVHDCPLQCDQLLSCGTHRCQDTCHKGKCRPCLEAVFDDVACNCSRTRLEPPVRCGTKLPPCIHPCIRPNPCGHIRFLNHNCHPDEESCPPCPVLVTRHCLCGKTELRNVPCYRESPRCGHPCEKSLDCGKHVCLKSCHSGPCIQENETCTQTCGSSRSCGHACQDKCHGSDSTCPETKPCTEKIKASCKCGLHTVEILCNATAESSGSKKDLDCNDFCAKVLRNRRLAMAFDRLDDLNILPSSTSFTNGTDSPGPIDISKLSSDHLSYYDDTLRDFYKENISWCLNIENRLIEFIKSAEKTLYFKPMRKEYRRFIHRYAIHFNLATEAIDQEPTRSVVARKTLGNTRIPSILLSKAARNPSLARAPATAQEVKADTSGRSASRQPVNALYLSDMAFGLTKLELDADLVSLIKIGDDTIHFTSKWINENDAIVVPSISDSISMDEKEAIIWQLKKIVKEAFVSIETDKAKAARIDCCWVNQKGELVWNEKQLETQKRSVSTTASQGSSSNRTANAYDALKSVDDDGWMRVGTYNPFRPAKDAWNETSESSAYVDTKDSEKVYIEETAKETIKEEDSSSGSEVIVEGKQENDKAESSSCNSNNAPESDDWEVLLEDN